MSSLSFFYQFNAALLNTNIYSLSLSVCNTGWLLYFKIYSNIKIYSNGKISRFLFFTVFFKQITTLVGIRDFNFFLQIFISHFYVFSFFFKYNYFSYLAFILALTKEVNRKWLLPRSSLVFTETGTVGQINLKVYYFALGHILIVLIIFSSL